VTAKRPLVVRRMANSLESVDELQQHPVCA
jgi:hypothetical protein